MRFHSEVAISDSVVLYTCNVFCAKARLWLFNVLYTNGILLSDYLNMFLS